MFSANKGLGVLAVTTEKVLRGLISRPTMASWHSILGGVPARFVASTRAGNFSTFKLLMKMCLAMVPVAEDPILRLAFR